MADKVVKILIVDDLPQNLLATQETLKPLDLKIHTATSGSEALTQMAKHEFAVILIEVQMSAMDGFETASLIKKSNGTRDTPIIFVTAISKDEQHVLKRYEFGAVDYVFKPVNPDVLISKVEVFVNLYRAQIENKQLIEEINMAKNLASLGVLADGIAHDFNNLLTAVIGNIDLARMAVEKGGEADGYLSKAMGALKSAGQLTIQLLTFAKDGAPVKKMAGVAELIQEACSFVLSGSNCKYNIDIPKRIYSVSIDNRQISQVLQNLLLNAMEAMPSGGKISITVDNFDINKDFSSPLTPGKYIKICVTDNGPGIDKQIINQVFDPYFSTKQTEDKKNQGLGLSVCNSIIATHDGHIKVQSEPGSGAAFHVYLPASDTNMQFTSKAEGESATTKDVSPGAKSGKILVMDDEDVVRNLVMEMLSLVGYMVVVAKDGEEAVNIYKEAAKSEQPIDLVIMDLTVPGGMGGEEAVKIIHKINPQARVIVSSGYDNEILLTNYNDYGFCGVLKKPFTKNELFKTVDHAM